MEAATQSATDTKYLGSATVQIEPDRIKILAPRRPSFRFLLGPALVIVLVWFSPKYHAMVFSDPGVMNIFSFFIGLLLVKGIWDATSRDIILVDEKNLLLNRGILGVGWTRRYPLREVGNLRWTPGLRQGRAYIPSRILFDYQYMPIMCALEVEEGAANQIIALLKRRFPQMGSAAQVSVF
jgi:hypothetical protein